MIRSRSDRQVWIQTRGRSRRPVEDGIESLGRTFPAKGNSARRHFIKNTAKGEQIAACIQFLGSRLLGRHVGHRPQRRARAGQVRIARARPGRIARRGARSSHLRQAEVENLGVSTLGDENVCGLDVAVENALGVRRIQPVGHFDGQRQQGLQLQRTAHDRVLQRHAVQEFHGDESLAVLLINFVDGADVGMVERRCRLRLPLKAAERLRVAGNLSGKELERDEAVQLHILGFVHHAHTAAAKLFENAVMRESLADHCARILRG